MERLKKVIVNAKTCWELKIDFKLMYDSNVKSLCKKANQKLNAVSRVPYELDFNQIKFLMNAFITSQFFYAYDRNPQKQVTEVFEILEDPYALRNELRTKIELKSKKIQPVRYSIETAPFLGSRF